MLQRFPIMSAAIAPLVKAAKQQQVVTHAAIDPPLSINRQVRYTLVDCGDEFCAVGLSAYDGRPAHPGE